MLYLEIGRQMLLLPSIQFVHRAAADDPGASAYGVLPDHWIERAAGREAACGCAADLFCENDRNLSGYPTAWF